MRQRFSDSAIQRFSDSTSQHIANQHLKSPSQITILQYLTAMSLPHQTTIGAVALTVSDLERSLAYYQNNLGLALQRRENNTAWLGARQSESKHRPFLILTEQPGARHPGRTTGLYHFAILTPSRLALAKTLRQLAGTKTPVSGFADHGVSEAIYLSDPDGNGIEIYHDRKREEWPSENGALQMVNAPLDLEGILAELQGKDEPWTGLHPDTVPRCLGTCTSMWQIYPKLSSFTAM